MLVSENSYSSFYANSKDSYEDVINVQSIILHFFFVLFRQDGPSTKQFLSEERMAARMHNLRISSDHNYPVNIIQRFMDSFNQASKSSQSQIDDDDDDEFENADETQRR